MEYEDLYQWLQRRRGLDAQQPQPINISIDLGDLLARLLTDRGEVKVVNRINPSPG